MSAPSVSVVLCTRNRARLLERALEALSRQSDPPGGLEIVVVDDGSTDDTPAVCAAFAARIEKLRVVRSTGRRGQAGAATHGVARAGGEVLLFTDDDCVPRADWALRLSAALADHPFVAGAIESPRRPYALLCHNVAQFHAVMCGRRGSPLFVAGANFGVRRSLLERLGGFDCGLALAHDMELSLRARERECPPRFEPLARVLHLPPTERATLPALLRYASRHAAVTGPLRVRHARLLGTPAGLRAPLLLRAGAPLVALWVTAGIFARARGRHEILHTLPVVFATKVAWCWGAARGLEKQR